MSTTREITRESRQHALLRRSKVRSGNPALWLSQLESNYHRAIVLRDGLRLGGLDFLAAFYATYLITLQIGILTNLMLLSSRKVGDRRREAEDGRRQGDL